jgi:hypothetical protein
MLSWSEGRYLDGLWVGAWRSKSDVDRVEQALHLIKQTSPVHYNRVTRDLKRVWVYVLRGYGAVYENALNACMIDERYVANSTLERIASTIIHEATHARLEARGIVYEESLRSRIEAICLRRELAFVATLPNNTELHDELVRSVKWCSADNEWFSDTNFHERDNTGAVEALQYLKTPTWLIRVAPMTRAAMSGIRRLYRQVPWLM